MIEDNYSQINYIRENGATPRYNFIPREQMPPRKPKKSYKGAVFMIGVCALSATIGLEVRNHYNTIVVLKDMLLQSRQTNVAAAQLAETGPEGSDDSATSTLVVEKPSKSPKKNYTLVNPNLLPAVGADAFLIADVDTGEIIAEKNGTNVYPIASVSKLMTAVVSTENLDMHQSTVVTKDALKAYGTEGELIAGENILLTDLLYPLLIESSNDAAEVFAQVLPEGKFIGLMNKKAAELGMINTHYEDPSGLTPHNVSTVEDLFKLATYIYKNNKDIWDTTRVKGYSILRHNWVNHSHFLGYPNFMGGKNGYTDEARRTSVTIFSIPVNEDETRTLSLIVLKTENREKDIATLLDYIKKNVIYTE